MDSLKTNKKIELFDKGAEVSTLSQNSTPDAVRQSKFEVFPAEFFFGPALWVYAWVRGKTCLYVGSSSHLPSRFGNHHVINKKEPIQPGDKILLRRFGDYKSMLTFEKEAIRILVPKHNVEGKNEFVWDRDCPNCNISFETSKPSQKFCSKECREQFHERQYLKNVWGVDL